MDYATPYHFLARAFQRPADDDFLSLVAEIDDLKPFLSEDLKSQFSWLFEFNVYPYASVFIDSTGMLNSDWSGFVSGVYEAMGLELSLTAGLAAADHIAAECEALAILCERAESQDALAKSAAEHWQKVLLLEHLLPWLPSFAHAIKRIDSGFYARLADLALELSLNHALDLLQTELAAPFQFPEAQEGFIYSQPGEFKTKAKAARAELQTLITAARSGLFLSREDIIRLGRSLDLPVRFAERPFMLENLLSSAADAELLAELFRHWLHLLAQESQNIAALQQAYPPFAEFWTAWLKKLEQSSSYMQAILET